MRKSAILQRYTMCGSLRSPQQHLSAQWTHQIGDPGKRYGRDLCDPGEGKVGSSCNSEAHVGEDLVDLHIHSQHEWTTDFDRGYLQLITTKRQYTSGFGSSRVATSVKSRQTENCTHFRMAQTQGEPSTRNSWNLCMEPFDLCFRRPRLKA